MKKKRRKDEEERLTRKQKLALAGDIYEQMIDGATEDEIIKDLGVSAEDFASAKNVLLETKGEQEERMSPRARFARYLIEQERNIVDLNDLVNNLNSKSQYSAIIGAIRMRAEIADKVIATGQTLGLITKEPDKKLLLGGLALADMKEKDLRQGVLDAIGGLGKMLTKYQGDTNIRALAPGPLHQGEVIDMDPAPALEKPVMQELPSGKKNRAKSGKRAAGRRRVRD